MELKAAFLLLIFIPRLECVTVAQDISPPGGSTVAQRLGSMVTFNCSIFNNNTGNQQITEWRVRRVGESDNKDVTSALGSDVVEYGGIPLTNPFNPFFYYRNVITLRNYDFHNLVLWCTFSREVFAEFFLFTYRSPLLANFTTVKLIQGHNVSIRMEEFNWEAYPFPSFTWRVGGDLAMNSTMVSFSYPSITFWSVESSLSGTYSLSALNYFLDEPSRVLGSDLASFMVDVLFGPSLRRGDQQVAVELGSPLSLLCGDQLRSNPPPTITWRNPAGGVVKDNTRLDLISDIMGVRLNFSQTVLTDNGQWLCSVVVTGQEVTLPPDGVTAPSVEVGRQEVELRVLVVDSPGRPTNLVVEETGGVWATLSWTNPTSGGLQGISHHVLTARDITSSGSDRDFITTNSTSEANMTNLLPATNYNFTVQAVSKALAVEVRGQESEVAMGTTLLSTPAPVCKTAAQSNGGIDVEYGFIHTGGQAVTMVTISYVVMDISGATRAQEGPNVALNSTDVFVPHLVTGSLYTVRITAANLNGSSTASCPALNLTVGQPLPPSKPNAVELPTSAVRLTIRSWFPGSDRVTFIITTLQLQQDGARAVGEEIIHDVSSYLAGDEVDVVLSNLTTGEEYQFRVVVRNKFGSSSPVLSDRIVIVGIQPTTNASYVGSATFIIVISSVGGAVLAVIIVVVVIIIIITAMATTRTRKKKYKVPEIRMHPYATFPATGTKEKSESNKMAPDGYADLVTRSTDGHKEDPYVNIRSRGAAMLTASQYEVPVPRARSDSSEQQMQVEEVVAYQNVPSPQLGVRPQWH